MIYLKWHYYLCNTRNFSFGCRNVNQTTAQCFPVAAGSFFYLTNYNKTVSMCHCCLLHTVYDPISHCQLLKDTSHINRRWYHMERVLCHQTWWSCNLSFWLMWSTGVAGQSLLIITINNKLSSRVLGGCWHSLRLGTLCRMHYAFALEPQGVWHITLSLD